MLGRFDEARAILSEDRADQEERGGGILLANLTAFERVWVELWADDAAAAAKFAAEGWRLHLELGQSSFLPHAAANRARALYALGQLDEAEAWAVRAAELASERWTEMLWRQVRAKVHARRDEHADAERLAREAVAICDETELLNQQGDAYADLAEVLLLTGKPDEAAAALEQALERYERKGNLVSAQHAQTRITELQVAAPQ
jgi:tetratricopeptide (TPR) repeat protein